MGNTLSGGAGGVTLTDGPEIHVPEPEVDEKKKQKLYIRY